MNIDEIRYLRLLNQHILQSTLTKPEEVVSSMVAMQAQEYAMAKWAIGLRMVNGNEKLVEDAFQSGMILRTHLLRPTWHFVSPKDIRWLLMLTAPHIQRLNASMYKKTGLDPETLEKSQKVIQKALAHKAQLTREEIQKKLEEADIIASGQCLSYIMMNAELEGLICSGARIGKKFTYALLDDVAEPLEHFDRDQALKNLAKSYITSRGPATIQDFACWSGLPIKDAKSGFHLLGNNVSEAFIEGKNYYYFPTEKELNTNQTSTFLMPDYDEIGMGYKDRSVLTAKKPPKTEPSTYSHWLVLRGRIEGAWMFNNTSREKVETITPFFDLNSSEQKEIEKARLTYLNFWTNENQEDK